MNQVSFRSQTTDNSTRFRSTDINACHTQIANNSRTDIILLLRHAVLTATTMSASYITKQTLSARRIIDIHVFYFVEVTVIRTIKIYGIRHTEIGRGTGFTDGGPFRRSHLTPFAFRCIEFDIRRLFEVLVAEIVAFVHQPCQVLQFGFGAH